MVLTDSATPAVLMPCRKKAHCSSATTYVPLNTDHCTLSGCASQYWLISESTVWFKRPTFILDLSDALMQRPSWVQTAVVGDTDCYSEFMSQKKTLCKFLKYSRRKSRVWFQLMMQCISTRPLNQGSDQRPRRPPWRVQRVYWEYCEMQDKHRKWRCTEHFGEKSWGKMCHW